MLLTFGALLVFHLYFVLLGLPFLLLCQRQLSFYAQTFTFGFFFHILVFHVLSQIGLTPKEVFFPFLISALLGLGFSFRNKTFRSQFWIFLLEFKGKSVGLISVFFIFILLSTLFSYNAPYLFFNKPDTLYYLSTVDFHWDNSIYDLLNHFDRLTQNLAQRALAQSRSRTGLWHAFAPAYALLGINPYYYFSAFVFVLWNVLSSLSQNSVEMFCPELKSKFGGLSQVVYYLCPLSVFVLFECYLSHGIFIVFFSLFVLLCEILSDKIQKFSRSELVSFSFLFSVVSTCLVWVYPEFLAAPSLVLITFFIYGLMGAVKQAQTRKFLKSSFFMLLLCCFFLFIFSPGGTLHDLEVFFRKISGRDAGYDILRLAFPGELGSYFFSLIGGPLRVRFYSEQVYNLVLVLFLFVLFWSKPRVSKVFLSRMGGAFWVSFVVFSFTQTYAAIKLLASWGALITPLVTFLSEKRRGLFLSLISLCILCSFVYGFRRYWANNYIHYAYKDMEKVVHYVSGSQTEDILLLLNNHLQVGTFTIMLNRYPGAVYSAISSKWSRKENGEKGSKAYQKKVFGSCEAIKEKVLILKNNELEHKSFKKVKSCLKSLPFKKFGKFRVAFNG